MKSNQATSALVSEATVGTGVGAGQSGGRCAGAKVVRTAFSWSNFTWA